MTPTNATKAWGIVAARNGPALGAHEGITYGIAILGPSHVAGDLTGVIPVRKFDPGMNIHAANEGDPADITIVNNEHKVEVPEGVAFAPCAAGQVASGGGVFDRLIKVLKVQLGGATAAPSAPSSSGGVGE